MEAVGNDTSAEIEVRRTTEPKATNGEGHKHDTINLRPGRVVQIDCALGRSFFAGIGRGTEIRAPKNPSEGVYRLHLKWLADDADIRVWSGGGWAISEDLSFDARQGFLLGLEITVLREDESFAYIVRSIFQNGLRYEEINVSLSLIGVSPPGSVSISTGYHRFIILRRDASHPASFHLESKLGAIKSVSFHMEVRIYVWWRPIGETMCIEISTEGHPSKKTHLKCDPEKLRYGSVESDEIEISYGGPQRWQFKRSQHVDNFNGEIALAGLTAKMLVSIP